MAKQDYAVRSGSKKKKTANKGLLFAIAGIVVALFVGGLFLLKEKSPEVKSIPAVAVKEQKPKSQLPSRPEETWSYIKELESRTVTNTQSSQLSESQKAALKRLEEEEKAKQAALAKLKQQQEDAAAKAQAQTQTATDSNTQTTQSETAVTADKDPLLLQAEKAERERKAAEQKKLAEEKRLADEKRKEEQRKKAELAKAEQEKKATAKIETAKKEEPKKADNKPSGKFGLQCGAFNDKSKAENLQARLAMSGLNARITESGKWNRVLIGPIGDRPAAVAAQQQASSIAGCVVIGM